MTKPYCEGIAGTVRSRSCIGFSARSKYHAVKDIFLVRYDQEAAVLVLFYSLHVKEGIICRHSIFLKRIYDVYSLIGLGENSVSALGL